MLAERIHGIVANGKANGREARNFAIHLASLTATKTADGLVDPKLVLAWILSALGAPGYLIGALVPVREAGALLPQLALARFIQAQRTRRWIWAAGSLVQGLAAFGIAASAVLLQGAAAGWAILGCLAVLAVARSACSASYKDVLARTVAKGSRGTATGTAGSLAAAGVLLFAVLVSIGLIPREVWAIAGAIAVAGGLWLLAAATFRRLDEPEATPDAGAVALDRLARPLKRDPEFRSYLAARALLIATALAPPFIVMLAQGDDTTLGNLGALLIASSAAAIVSSYVWGRLSDRSSRKTLVLAGLSGAAALGATAAIGLISGGIAPTWLAGGCIFFAQIAYHAVRAGRSTHLADMDTGDRKPLYTALSNTVIGVLLLLGGAFGVIADLFGPAVVLALCAAMCAAAVLPAARLSELQARD